MNEQPVNTGIEFKAQPVPVQNQNFFSKILVKIPPQIRQKAKEIFMKFYSNKKIFWPVTLVFGLLFLVIVLGLIFGSPGQQIIRRAPTPSPFIAPTASPSGGILSVTENQLNDLNNQILDLDLKQSRLQPPTINYDISF